MYNQPAWQQPLYYHAGWLAIQVQRMSGMQRKYLEKQEKLSVMYRYLVDLLYSQQNCMDERMIEGEVIQKMIEYKESGEKQCIFTHKTHFQIRFFIIYTENQAKSGISLEAKSSNKNILLLTMQIRISLLLGIILLFSVPVDSVVCSSSQFLANSACYACHVSCLTCTSNTVTSCLTCGTTRFLNGQTACQCNDGYVEQGTVAATCISLTCSFRCLTCNNTATACTSCNAAHNRVYIASSLTCPCIGKYYDAGTGPCTACHYTCGQCNGVTSSACTFCDTSALRTLSGTSCPCNAGYFDNNVYTCAGCGNACVTCVTSLSNCLTCGANRGSAPTCVCSVGFYDDGISNACIACNIACRTCVNGTSCSICDANKFRLLTSISPLCVCMNRYFDAGAAVCSSCDPRCFTCLSTLICLTCNATAYRTYDTLTKFCLCMNGYYQTSTTVQLCAKCDSRCLTCSGTSTNCLTCDSTMNRLTDNAGNCPCKTGYFQNSGGTCSVCDSSCLSCNNNVSCTACVASTLQVINSSNLCSCPSTMSFNTALTKCEACNYRCVTCKVSNGSACLTCPANSFRTYSSFACPCNIHYYDDGSSATCNACDYTCNTCSSNLNTACLTCNKPAFRYLSSGRCLCMTYYYDNGALQLCQPCMYNCLTCVDSTSCSSCDATLYRALNTAAVPNTCSCSLYYFEATNKTCVSCIYHCYTCNTQTNCLTCDATAHRVFNLTTQLCDCMPGFYDNFVDQICLACLPQCLTCTNATTCTSCSAAANRVLSSTNRCPCKDLFFDVSGTCTACLYYCSTCNSPSTCTTCNGTAFRVLNSANQCVCSTNYYDDGSIQLCLPCSYACLTCVTTSNKCVTCDSTLRLLQSNWCACPQYFYDSNATVACVACHYTCSTCLQGNKCATCDATKFRNFDAINQYCVCMQAYYDDGVGELCKSCNLRCLACTNSSACLTCNPVSFRFTPASLCPCLDGYYDNNAAICLICQYTCQTCTNVTQCSTCEATTNHRVFNSNYTCSCMDRFYDDGKNNQLCLACVYTCLTCLGTATTCTSCNATAFRALSIGNCNCMQHYYDKMVQHCLPCHYTCLTCINATGCTSCDGSVARISNTTTGLCSCMIMFWDDGSSQKCNNCHPSCLTCLNTLSCLTCNITRNRMLNSSEDIYGVASPFCVCLYRFYSPATNQDCKPCHYSCQVCNGDTRQNCVICNATALRYFNAATTSCLCNNGTYDTDTSQLCLSCSVACTLCTTGLPNSCTACSPLYYLLAATTTCYITCPDFYFNYQKTATCQSCSKYCKSCLNQTYCSKCDTGSFLYNRSCLSACPDGTYTVAAQGLCNDCPNGCKSCNGTKFCSSCLNNYYYNSSLGFCFSCNKVCLTCSGPGQKQCLSCQSPLYLTASTCTVLSCSAGFYVDPSKGCQSCSSLFEGSLDCNINQSFSCQSSYKLINNACVYCDLVPGYRKLNGKCGQICGDGILIYLQCDDGNNLDGDGCSGNCLIEQGWSCTATGPSQCTLKSAITMHLLNYYKKAGVNQLQINMAISLPIILSSNHLALTITDLISTDFSYQVLQSSTDLNTLKIVLKYKANIQDKKLALTYNNTRRLQQSGRMLSNRLLTTISFSSTIPLSTYPPAVYYPPQTSSQFFQLQYKITALSICLLVLSLIFVPKKMHLHNLTFIYLPAQMFITYGLVADPYTDWIKYSLQNMNYSALIGGFSFGKCCTTQSTYYHLTSEVTTMSAIVFLVLLFSWIFYGLLQYFHSKCMNIEGTLKNVRYFTVTLNLAIIFTIIYSSMNSLYRYKLQTPTDTFNLVFGVLLSIFFLLMIAFVWLVTYLTIPPISKNDKTVLADNQALFEVPSQTEKKTGNPSSKRKMATVEQVQQIKSQKCKEEEDGQRLPEFSGEFLLNYDYISLYNNARRVMINGQPTVLFTKAKYFLPAMLTKVYLNAILASLVQSQPFYLFIISTFLQIIFVSFMLIVRPFTSKFTNFRIIIISMIMIAANVSIQIYMHNSINNNYMIFYERLTVYLILGTLALATLFIILEHIIAWSGQMWRIIEPCLKGTRLMGHRKNKFDIGRSSDSMKKSETKASHHSSLKAQVQRNQAQQIDAFYARMLKKQQLNKEYRRQRMLK